MDASSPGLWALLIFVWFAASVVFRRFAGRQVFAAAAPDAVFVERWASGRAGTGLLAGLSTAKNCLQVQVTSSELRLTPHFPFTLGFLPEIYGYDRAVSLASIRSVTVVGGRYAKAVEVRYADAGQRDAVIQVLLRRGDEFVAKIRPLVGAA